MPTWTLSGDQWSLAHGASNHPQPSGSFALAPQNSRSLRCCQTQTAAGLDGAQKSRPLQKVPCHPGRCQTSFQVCRKGLIHQLKHLQAQLAFGVRDAHVAHPRWCVWVEETPGDHGQTVRVQVSIHWRAGGKTKHMHRFDNDTCSMPRIYPAQFDRMPTLRPNIRRKKDLLSMPYLVSKPAETLFRATLPRSL